MSGGSDDQNNGSFGDTKAVQGFARLLEFVKGEQEKRRAMRTPSFQMKIRGLKKYEAQQSEIAQDEMKKGLQLKKAA